MRESLTPLLRCPACLSVGSLTLAALARDGREVRTGHLACARCEDSFPVVDGIADLLPSPPGFVRRESDGLDRFAAVMRADGWDRERILALPDVPHGYWHAQAQAMHALLERIDFAPRARLLDVGSNTCWASNVFAGLGLDVIALDIALAELQGLRTADYFFEDRGVYFERVRSTMFAPALASDSLDYVFCCEVLHHNDRSHLRRTFAELFRVLRPGGRLLVVNEPMKFPLMRKRDHALEVAEFDGNEHVFFLHQYYLAARRAGFRATLPGLRRWPHPTGSRLKAAYRQGREVWRNLVSGDAALAMDCTKPAAA